MEARGNVSCKLPVQTWRLCVKRRGSIKERERGLRSCAYDESPGGERKRKKKRMLNCEQQLQKAKVGGNHLHASTVPKANEDNHRFNSFRQTISYPYELLEETLPVTGLPGREESPCLFSRNHPGLFHPSPSKERRQHL